ITVEDTVELPTKNEISKKGYEFVGWYENEGFISDRQTEISKGTTHDVELYAKWTPLDSADKQALEKAIKKAEKVSTKGMTKDSVLTFNTLIEDAKVIINDEKVNQDVVDEITTKVNKAEEILVVDKSELEEKIKEGKKV